MLALSAAGQLRRPPLYSLMRMSLAAKSDRIDLMFRAFSDRTRLRILSLLTPGELCVCDLVRVIAAPQPKISRHLAYLRKAGLVTSRKDGLWMHYALASPKGAFHRNLMECLACCFSEAPELARDRARLGKACRARGPCCD